MQKLLVGTSKGLIVYSKQSSWKIESVQFLGFPVSMVYVDERTNTWWICLAHRHWGQKLHRSTNSGKSWEQVAIPRFPVDAEINPNKKATLKKIWVMQHAGVSNPNGLWMGTEPGGLFYSQNNGDSFDLVRSLWDHPSRIDVNQWFGAGRDYPFIHSIIVNPENNKHVYIAVSCAGVFETKDGGLHWVPKNKGLVAAYLPNPNVEVGHDPHLVLQCKADLNVLWQQNHCGVFLSTDAGENWVNKSDQLGYANYGFALAIDENNPNRAWVIPATSDDKRYAKGLALVVSRTEDGGQTWQQLRKGLPQSNCFDIVFRHALVRRGKTLAFGTNNGNLYLSEDDGDNWTTLSNQLARIDYLFFA